MNAAYSLDAELSQAAAIRQPCLWGEPDPILGLNMEPLQLTSEAKKLLRALPDQPETPLGELAEPDLIRDLVDRQLILLRA